MLEQYLNKEFSRCFLHHYSLHIQQNLFLISNFLLLLLSQIFLAIHFLHFLVLLLSQLFIPNSISFYPLASLQSLRVQPQTLKLRF
jgi:hypothetical protein